MYHEKIGLPLHPILFSLPNYFFLMGGFATLNPKNFQLISGNNTLG
jgi:hypothetical protein